MHLPRSSGLLMPVFSLPDSDGIGDFGDSAYRFVDFLKASGQQIWQLLPLGPAARGDSPYSSYSAFAGSPLFINPRKLVATGLLSESDVANLEDGNPSERVDYQAVRTHRAELLKKACENFAAGAAGELINPLAEFCETNQAWLEDFALYEALALEQDEFDWSKWEPALVQREEAALADARERLASQIQTSRFQQFLFDRQWRELKQYANDAGIRIYGDMPIFVAYESADVWANQYLYQLGDNGRPTVVAGVPPDYFSATGQMWGNPLYDWPKHAESNYEWWVRRLWRAFECFDLLRLDHFRGFESYWEIPADAEDATSGQWKPAPGDELFAAVRSALGDEAIIAEDLGLITDEVHALRERLNLPGMRVLQFGFDHHDDPYHRPESYPPGSVAYTGTHDNETVMGWYLRREHEEVFRDLIGPLLLPDAAVHISLMKSVLDSAADTVVVPVQDCLGLDNSARMNIPGEPDGNWAWRCAPDVLTDQLAKQIRQLTEEAGRLAT